MKILDKIDKPSDLKLIRKELLPQLVNEIRQEIIETVSKTGGHLASNLGTVELIVALHYVFDTPKDKIIFDVGHQSYAHKIITGRREKFSTLRQLGGISGFPARKESEYDVFGAGHSSAAISAGLGFAVSRDLRNEENKVVVVIGDGSITGGMAFEGLNNAGHLGRDLLIILNDNEMYISHRVGAIAGYLTRILTLGLVKKVEKRLETLLKRLHFMGLVMLRVAKRFKLLIFPGMLFEEMGFAYLGPINGHNLNNLIDIIGKVKNMKGPVVLHVITRKGKGYEPAEKDPVKFHGVAQFEIETGNENTDDKMPSFTRVFSDTLVKLAEKDKRVVAVTAAMAEGAGLVEFAKKYPDRFFDVGIAEQHALTFAAGLAAGGFRPFCAIYSTFLQRGFDQIIHDIALQNLPVVIAVDRAGLVGRDGATHQGMFDLSFLGMVPNLCIMAPKDGCELSNMLYSALSMDCPVAIRYPRSKTVFDGGVEFEKYEKGKSEIIKQGKDLYFVAVGNMVNICLKSADILSGRGIGCGVINARFVKPLDTALLKKISSVPGKLVTVEENTISGGFGSYVREYLANEEKTKILSIALPDEFIEHGSQEELREKYGLTPEMISDKVLKWLKK